MISNPKRQAQGVSTSFHAYRWASVLLYLGALTARVLFYAMEQDKGTAIGPWQLAAVAGIVLLLSAIEVFEAYRFGESTPRTVAIAFLATRMILIELAVQIGQLHHFNLALFLYLSVPFNAYFSLGGKISCGLILIYLAISAARRFLFSPMWYRQKTEEHISALMYLAIGLGVVILAARAIHRERASRAHVERLLKELETSHQELKSYAAQAVELAATEERNRLARDIHDGLGHYLTAINILLEKALTFRERNPREAEQAMRDAKRSAKEALQDVRQSVAALRDTRDAFSFTGALVDMANNTRSDRLAIELQVNGQEAGFSKLVLMMLYRAAQEGLTNVQKHAGASHVAMEVSFGQNSAVLTLSDDGQGFDPSLLSKPSVERDTFGLQGMRERLELVGGSLRLESAPDRGTRLVITAPRDPTVIRGIAGDSGRREQT